MTDTSQAGRPLVFEIGTEELPAAVVTEALEQLAQLAASSFSEARLGASGITTMGTPRRLILQLDHVESRQEDLREWVRGPSRKAAFDEEGNPTRAAQGFARGQGEAVDDLVTRETDNGEYVFAERVAAGKAALEVLQELLPVLVEKLQFSRTMRWGNQDFRFARPIRWFVALYGSEVVSFELADVTSGRTTYGHRSLAPGPIDVPGAEEFTEVLRKGFVVPESQERSELIREQALLLAEEAGGHLTFETSLLDEVVQLVEWPTAFLGRFSPDYLDLPAEVLTTSMRVHQRYFPVVSTEGALLPVFVGVRNGGEHNLDTVRAGNEKVLRARLADARFFYEEDQDVPLPEYVERLKHVVFQDQLGTFYDKTQRVRALAGNIGSALKVSPEVRDYIDRAAELCKADQVTAMVQEFPELEGVMGREYARLSGEPEPVARAIFEHHLPRGTSDELPQTMAGTIVSLADKLDTLAGCFAVGIQPSGSQDPYALRRKALACLHLLRTAQLNVDLGVCVDLALDQYDIIDSTEDRKTTQSDLMAFFQRRFEGLLRDAGFRYDVVDAVLGVGFGNVPEVWERAQQLEAFRQEESFADVMVAFTRAHNLAHNVETDQVREELLDEEPEAILYRAVEELLPVADECSREGEYANYLSQAASLRNPVDNFLDNLMVMVDEASIRRNRLALLRKVDELLTRHFDLSRLES